MTTRIYAGSVNYRDGSGDFKPIDNSLVAGAGDTDHNAANRYDVTLPSTLDTPVKVSTGGGAVSFALAGASGTRKVDDNTATYTEAVPGVDAAYTAGSDSVKEDLALSGPDSTRQFSFDLNPTVGLTPSLNKAGGVDFTDSAGDVTMSFAAPVMTDDKGATSTDLSYRLKQAGSGYTLSLDADTPWLNKGDRSWPVKVDPTVYFGDNYDTYVVGGDAANTQYGPAAYTTVATNGDHIRRALYKFNFSGIPTNAVVEDASLNLHTYGGAGSGWPIEAHKLTHSFTTSATWNKYDGTNAWGTAGGDYEPQALDTVNVRADGWYTWYIGNTVQDWVSGSSANNGLLLKAPTEATNQVGGGQGASFYGVMGGGNYPWLEVNWEYPTGQLPQQTFDTYRINDRSQLKVNVATGDLTYQAQDVHATGVGGEDLNLTRTYDAQSQWDGAFGNKWMVTGGSDVWSAFYNNGATDMIHGPGDVYWRFTKHYTTGGSWDGTWNTPPGVNATLSTNSSGETLLFNRTGETWFFDSTKGDKLTWVKDKNGHKITYSFNGSNQVTSVLDTQGRTYTFNRNPSTPNHEVTSITDAAYPGGTRTWSYGQTELDGDPTFQILTSYTDPAGKITHYDYGSGTSLQTITDPRGNKLNIDYTIDANGYPLVHTVTRVTNATMGTGPTTLYCYNASASQTTVYDANGTGGSVGSSNDCSSPSAAELAHKITYTWAPTSGEVTTTTNQLGEQATGAYTANGDVSATTDQTQGSGAITAPITFTHDTSGGTNNLTGGTGAAGEAFSMTYYSATDTFGGSPASPATGQYRAKIVTDPEGSTTTYNYDAAGNTTTVLPGGSLSDSQTLAYTTSADAPQPLGLLKSATDHDGHVTTYSYTSTGNLTEIKPPLVGTKHPGDETFTYDAEGRVLTATDAKAQVANYGYDKLDRVCIVATGTPGTLSCSSTPAGLWVKYSYDENGNLTGRTDSAANSSTFTFDPLNRRTDETVAGSTLHYTYDDNSNLKTLQDAWGTTTYGYDALNRVQSIDDPGTQPNVTYSYNDTSSPRTETIVFPKLSGSGNGVTLKTSTDLSGKPTVIDTTTSTGAALRKLTYSYDLGSAHTELEASEGIYNAGTLSQTTSYWYDGLDRLCLATTGTISGTPACTSSPTGGTTTKYAFDAESNRLTKTVGATSTNYGYDAANELCWSTTGSITNHSCSPPTGATTYSSDDDGNRTGGLTYDAFNRLSNISGNAMTYLSPDNQELIGNGTSTIVNSLLGVDNYTTSGARTDYIRDPSGTLIGEHTSSGTRYRMADPIDSTRYLFSGDSVDRAYSYDPDGNATASGSGADSKFRFAGGLLAGASTTTPLYHFGDRYYDPAVGRWTQRDPLSSPQSLLQANPYIYAGQDPLNLRDPRGDDLIKDVGDAIGCAFAFAVDEPDICDLGVDFNDIVHPDPPKYCHEVHGREKCIPIMID